MSRYKKFRLVDEYIDAGQALVHTIHILDLAGEMANEVKDFDRLLQVAEQMQKVSECLIALAIETAEEEQEDEKEIVRTNGDFGFAPKSPQDYGSCEPEDE